MDPTASAPVEKNVVLVGAGNAHLRFVKMFGMKPLRGVAVTLVCHASTVPYSAMVPGHIAGDYAYDEISIDLVRLCRAMGVRFVADFATAIDTLGRVVRFEGRPELRYDVLSLGVGSMPATPPGLDASTSWPMRPLDRLTARLDELHRSLVAGPRPFHLALVGGGASGCELALAIRKRFRDIPAFRLTLVQSDPRLLPRFPDKAGRIFTERLKAEGVALRLGAVVTGGDAHSLTLNGNENFPFDVVLWATNAAPPVLIATTGLPCDGAGFLRVGDTLQSVGDPSVFGTGDCITLESHPALPKNGVYAVREGGVLFENVGRFLHERPLKSFIPQSRCLTLLNTADAQAVFSYGPIVWKGRLTRRLKDWIDRRWIDKFTRFPAMNADEEDAPQMRCGGCGNKVSADVLSNVLRRIDLPTDPRVLLGAHDGEDASVYRMRTELYGSDPARLVEVQTVDYFKAFLDDPYLFGRIAALNSVSDLFAMNARPFSALAIATLPYARGPVQEGVLFELMSGAAQTLRELGVVLAGGHTTEGPELALGFSVTGYAEEGDLFQKSLLRPGDVLILCKPLGSGALLAAWMRGECRAEWYTHLVRVMLRSNGPAAAIFRRHGVRACTDVTGFGLAGHLLEMTDGSKVVARIDPARVPVYPGFAEVVGRGIVSSLQKDNAKAECRIDLEGAAPAWMFDPQTSGGLIAGVKADEADVIVRELRAAGYDEAADVGAVEAVGDRGPGIRMG
jgi:selenide,water dikinase